MSKKITMEALYTLQAREYKFLPKIENIPYEENDLHIPYRFHLQYIIKYYKNIEN